MRSLLLSSILVTALLATHPLWAYEVVPVTDGGVLTGTVVFRGTPPEPKKVLISKDTEVCGEGQRELRAVEVAADGGLKHAVVSLEGITRGKAWATESFVLDQRGCEFQPYLQIVRNGAELGGHGVGLKKGKAATSDHLGPGDLAISIEQEAVGA